MIEIYRKAAEHPKVKKAFIGSGIRYDMLVDRPADETRKNGYNEYIDQVVKNHVSGAIKSSSGAYFRSCIEKNEKTIFCSFSFFQKII